MAPHDGSRARRSPAGRLSPRNYTRIIVFRASDHFLPYHGMINGKTTRLMDKFISASFPRNISAGSLSPFSTLSSVSNARSPIDLSSGSIESLDFGHAPRGTTARKTAAQGLSFINFYWECQVIYNMYSVALRPRHTSL